MSSFAIGMNKKIPFIIGVFDTIEQADAAGAASDAEDYTACSAAKLGDTFTLTELAHIFNNLPGEEKVERFSDKQSAVRRVLAKFEANKDALPPATGKRRKSAAASGGKKREGVGRPRAKLDGKIKPLKLEGKRWQKESVRSAAYQLLVERGAMAVEDFIEMGCKELKLTRGQMLGIVGKLRAVKMADVG